MQEIHSPSSTGRRVRAVFFLLFIAAFAVAYLWDGYRGYPHKNAVTLWRTLGQSELAVPAVDPSLSAATAEQLRQELAGTGTRALVRERLGTPALMQDGHEYYLGPGGHLRIQYDGERVREAEWKNGVHSDADLAWQKGIGAALALVAVVMLVHLVRVLRTRATLTEAGLRVTGRSLIGFDAITGVRLLENDRYGRIAVEYTLDGRKGRVLMDDYVYRDSDKIVAAICERKGLANPSAS